MMADANSDELAIAKAAIEEFRKERDEAEASGFTGSLNVHKDAPSTLEESSSSGSSGEAAYGYKGAEAAVARSAVDEWRKELREAKHERPAAPPAAAAALLHEEESSSSHSHAPSATAPRSARGAAAASSQAAAAATKRMATQTSPPSRIKWSDIEKT